MNKKLLAFLLASPASAEIIYASSYNDHAVTALNLNGSSLTVLGRNYDCGSEPTWLTLDKAKGVLYCLNEGWGGAASITSYKTSASGSLSTLDVLSVLKSPVSSTLFGADKSKLAVAYYDTSAFGTFDVSNPSDLKLLKQETYSLSGPGTVPERQDAPHLHDAVLDPTGQFLVVPDLGADLLRIYQVTDAVSGASAVGAVKAVPGSGPRHVAFATAGDKTYLYSTNELSNTITGYRVDYKCDAIPEFTSLFTFSTHGPGGSVPAGTKSAEIEVSPDQKFLIVSSRGEGLLKIPSFDPASPAEIVSDPLVSFAINGTTGALTHVQTAPAGGRNPRGFSLNKAGTLVVSALQDDNRVVVIERDVKTGLLGKIVAHATVGVGANNGPNYALFDE
ncbi:Lactonase, 7-bladed beta-propeller-domain-containing protein [Podospora aff. communis PSN243]|uniref:Lactonase, 7-bladed beta-propeller-domain-containing protein n=1 Tax=Podospora aff. communis PSN243 TaxID=3040156 RepID=A0AAV9GMW3_9PEZI|nr:Lactonase, 7-bladed beta-propeller-domain-containing protein [Podospora aff. communis PSN243]